MVCVLDVFRVGISVRWIIRLGTWPEVQLVDGFLWWMLLGVLALGGLLIFIPVGPISNVLEDYMSGALIPSPHEKEKSYLY